MALAIQRHVASYGELLALAFSLKAGGDGAFEVSCAFAFAFGASVSFAFAFATAFPQHQLLLPIWLLLLSVFVGALA